MAERTQGGKRKTREEIIGSDTNEWKSFEDMEDFVSKVKRKALHGGYESASEVLEDYKIFYALVTKITEELEKNIPISIKVAEYFCRYAEKETAMMLWEFSTMSLYGRLGLQHDHIQSIHQHLKENDPKELLMNAEITIRNLDGLVNDMDEDVQSEIHTQKKKKLKCLKKIQNEFRTGGLGRKVQEFEDLKRKISSTEKIMKTLGKRFSTCYTILGDRSTMAILGMQFSKLLRDNGEEHLAVKWSKVTEGVMELVNKEVYLSRSFTRDLR